MTLSTAVQTEEKIANQEGTRRCCRGAHFALKGKMTKVGQEQGLQLLATSFTCGNFVNPRGILTRGNILDEFIKQNW